MRIQSGITLPKSMDEALRNVLLYPDPKPYKRRQYKRNQLPCVVTSEVGTKNGC